MRECRHDLAREQVDGLHHLGEAEIAERELGDESSGKAANATRSAGLPNTVEAVA